MKTNYRLIDVKTGRTFADEGWTLDDPECPGSLIRAVYENKELRVGPDEAGLYKFADWMPLNRVLKGSSAPVTYKSEKLAKELGLENLYIIFNGYWPEIGANMQTCSFKETEAYTVCGRLKEGTDEVLVVASAGNTARAFAKVCSENRIPLLLCVPEDNLNALWFEQPLNDCVKLLATEKGSDYYDAIRVSNIAVQCDRFFPEGGAKNIARRDGMATTMLSAATTIGRTPDYYFQAVGSGTGAIAAWEAVLRLLEDGHYGKVKTRLCVSQNYPFIPMYKAWKKHSRDLFFYDDRQAREHVEEIDAKVLSNRKPPYSVFGGLFDALTDTDGDMLYVENTDARCAGSVFEKLEGVDIHPASAVAVASLVQAVEQGIVGRKDVIALNITGGGEKRFKEGKELWYMQPDHVFPIDTPEDEIKSVVCRLF